MSGEKSEAERVAGIRARAEGVLASYPTRWTARDIAHDVLWLEPRLEAEWKKVGDLLHFLNMTHFDMGHRAAKVLSGDRTAAPRRAIARDAAWLLWRLDEGSAMLRRLRAIAGGVEYNHERDGVWICGWCNGTREDGHLQDCELATILRDTAPEVG